MPQSAEEFLGIIPIPGTRLGLRVPGEDEIVDAIERAAQSSGVVNRPQPIIEPGAGTRYDPRPQPGLIDDLLGNFISPVKEKPFALDRPEYIAGFDEPSGMLAPGTVDVNARARPLDEDYFAKEEADGTYLRSPTAEGHFGKFQNAKSAEEYAETLKRWNKAGAEKGLIKRVSPDDSGIVEQVGMLEKPNIDLNKQPFPTPPIEFTKDHKIYLLPTVIDGKEFSKTAAIADFKKTGKHLGVFDSNIAAKEFMERQGMTVPTQFAEGTKGSFLGIAPQSPGKPQPTPVTYYSYGRSVGGPDEIEDDWTNRGYSAGGRKNLTEGVAAVNPRKYPLGTVFRDTDSGKILIASDTHGGDPDTVDVFAEPKNYRKEKTTRNFQVVDQIPEDQIPHTREGIEKLLAEYNRGTNTREPVVPGQPDKPVQITNGIDPQAPYMKRPRPVEAVNRIIVHGDVNQDAQQLVEYGRKVDKARGFDPGYHFYIDRDGKVIQGAPVDRITNHAKGENQNSIGINIAGADEGRMPTPAQETAAKKLIAELGSKYGIDHRNVVGHGELQPNRRHGLEGGYVARDIRERGYEGAMSNKMRDWGIVRPGNIDLSNRPIVHNPDGTVSTLDSISFQDEDGRETLIPRVINGQRVPTEDAIAHYRSTGQHLGKFKTPEQANAYAERLHSEEATRTDLEARKERMRTALERTTGALRKKFQEEGVLKVPRAEKSRGQQARENRAELSEAIARTEKAGYPVKHFIGKPNEPEGDRAPTLDMENLVNALKQQRYETKDPKLDREIAYWENKIKTQGMTHEQWRKQTGEPDPGQMTAEEFLGLTIPEATTGLADTLGYRQWIDAYTKKEVRRASKYVKAEEFIEGVEAVPAAQSFWKNAINSLGRGATSEGSLMAAEGAYAMAEHLTKGTKAEKLFSPSAQQREAAGKMRDTVRDYLHVDQEFANSITGMILEGFGQLAMLPLYAFLPAGVTAGVSQLFQEARDDYKQTMKDQGKEVSEEEANKAGMAYLKVAAPLELIADALIVGKLWKGLKKVGKKITAGQLAKTFLAMASAGGATEGGQQLWLNYIAKELQKYDPGRKMDEGFWESVIVGAVVEGVAGTAAEPVGRGVQKLEERAAGKKAPPATGSTSARARQSEYEKERAKARPFVEKEPGTFVMGPEPPAAPAPKPPPAPPPSGPAPAPPPPGPAPGPRAPAPGAAAPPVTPPARAPAPKPKPKPPAAPASKLPKEVAGKTIYRGYGREKKEAAYNEMTGTAIAGPGNYYSLKEEHAKEFGPQVESVKADDVVTNPIVIRSGQDWKALTKKAGWEFPNPFGTDPKLLPAKTAKLRATVEGMGHDGIVVIWDDEADTDTGPKGENYKLLNHVFGRSQVISYKPKSTAEPTTAADVQGPTAVEPSEPFLEQEQVEADVSPGVVQVETRERSQYEPGSRESFEYAARQVNRNFPGLPMIEVVDTWEQVAPRFPNADPAFANAEAVYDGDLGRIIMIRDNMQDAPPEALQEYIARLAMRQAAPVGGLSRMLEGTPHAEAYQQALLRAFPEVSVIDFGSAFGDQFGYQNLVEMAKNREADIQDPKAAAKLIEEHASNVAGQPTHPRWFEQLGSDIQAIMAQLGVNLNPLEASALLQHSGPATEAHRAEQEARQDAVRAAEQNPYVLEDISLGQLRNQYPEVRLAHLEEIRIVEMPELIKLARYFVGNLPILKKMRKALGQAGFKKGTGEKWLYLHPDIFKDYVVAGKVIAHELGHHLDLFAHGKFKGLKGLALKLSKDKKVVKDELVALTHWWKPWDEATAPESYTNYRKSGVELLADALSVFFNSPAELKARAPKFFDTWMDFLDGHTDIKDQIFALQALLHRPHMELLSLRSKELREGFTDAGELWMAAKSKRKTTMESLRGWIQDLKDQFYFQYNPAVSRQRGLEKRGVQVDRELDLRRLFDEHPMADNLIYTWLDRMKKEVIDKLHDFGLTQEDLGEYLLLNRAMQGAYYGKAVPRAHNPWTARQGLYRLRSQIGLDRWQVLERYADRFHDYVFEIMKEAYMSGMISKDMFLNVIVPNRHTYATFRPIDHVEDHVGTGLYSITGFLDDAENPFFSTMLKMIAFRRGIQWQRAKSASIKFIQQYYPGQIYRRLPLNKHSPEMRINDPKETGIIKVKEDGSWFQYEVPADYARMFDRPKTPAEVNAFFRALHWTFRKGFYQTFIKFNPAFQLVRSPMRDFQRLYTNMPAGVGFRKTATNYLQAIPAAARRLKGEIDPIVMEMYENMAMATPHDTFARNIERDDPLEMIMQQYHLLPETKKAAWRRNKIMEVLEKLGGWVVFNGQVLEAAPKVAAYKILTKDLGWHPQKAAAYVRNYIGVPNYLKKGRKAFAAGTLMPFWNVAIQGLTADTKLFLGHEETVSVPKMTAKKIAARSLSWWLKFTAVTGIYAIMQALARHGFLGDDMEELMAGVSEYTHTNYMVIPLGKMEGGDFGYKTMFLQIPQDELSRMIGGLLKKTIDMAATRINDTPHDPFLNEMAELFGFAGGQLPGTHPLLAIGGRWLDYSMGHNPYDMFRGQHILTRDQHLAGGWASLKPMFGMTADMSGITNFFKFNSDADTTTEAVIENVPILGAILKVSDYGLLQKQQRDVSDPKEASARLRVNLPDNVAKLLREYNVNRSLGKHRTQYQQRRYDQLKVWHKNIYEPTFESAARLRDMGGDPSDMLRRLGESSEGWE